MALNKYQDEDGDWHVRLDTGESLNLNTEDGAAFVLALFEELAERTAPRPRKPYNRRAAREPEDFGPEEYK